MPTRKYTTLPYTEYETEAFDSNRVTIDRIVIHSTVCTVQQAINTFSSSNATTSAHYIVGNDGKLYAGLEEYNVAYHAGNYPMNQRSIGIEHEWYSGIHPTDQLYATSAALVKDICNFYGIPIDSTHIIPHKSVVATSCPNEIDVQKIIQLASGSAPTTDDCPTKLAQVTAERDRLNTIIGTVKDPQIADLTNKVTTCTSSLASITAEKNSLAVQLSECQKQSVIYKAEYDNANSPTGYKAQIAQLETTKKSQATEISTLTQQVSYWQTKFNNSKKPIQKLIIALAEKMGVQL